MREQVIDLPQTVDELQLLCLQLREELIETRAAKEHSVAELKDELTIIQEQLKDEQIERKRVEENLAREHSKVFTELEQARRQVWKSPKKLDILRKFEFFTEQLWCWAIPCHRIIFG